MCNCGGKCLGSLTPEQNKIVLNALTDYKWELKMWIKWNPTEQIKKEMEITQELINRVENKLNKGVKK